MYSYWYLIKRFSPHRKRAFLFLSEKQWASLQRCFLSSLKWSPSPSHPAEGAIVLIIGFVHPTFKVMSYGCQRAWQLRSSAGVLTNNATYQIMLPTLYLSYCNGRFRVGVGVHVNKASHHINIMLEAKSDRVAQIVRTPVEVGSGKQPV